MTLNGFDISNVNGPGIITRALGGDFVICKATEGKGFVDPLYPSFMRQIRAAGKLTGSYHFAHWYNSPATEAAFYGAHNDRRDGELEILDWEMYGSPVCPPGTHGPWVAEFLALRPRCGLYTNSDMMNHIIASADAAQMKLIRSRVFWKATVGGTTPGNAYGFDRGVSIWQWNDQRGIDEDRAFITPQEWRSLANGNNTPAQPVGDDVGNVDSLSPAALDQIGDRVWSQIVKEAGGARAFALLASASGKPSLDQINDGLNNVLNHVDSVPSKVQVDVPALAEAVAALLPKPLSVDDVKALVQEVVADSINVTATLSVDKAE